MDTKHDLQTKRRSLRIFGKNFSLNGAMQSDTAPLIVNSAGLQSSPPIFHTQAKKGRVDYYLLYLTEGKMPLSFGDRQTLLHPGSFVIIPPGCPYDYYTDPGQPVSYFFVHFTGFWASQYLEQYGFRNLPCCIDLPISSDVLQKFQNLLYSFVPQKSFLDAELAARADSLLRALARLVKGERSPERIGRSLDYINRHYSEDIRISELAKLEFLSTSRYIAVFRELMGIPPAQYIIKVRLNTACVLLRESPYTVSEIASMVGYPEPHYFNSLFKRHIGIAPGEYRK